jgi:uncharacterized membrane protein YesL
VHIGLFISVNLVCVVSCRPWLRIVSLCCVVVCIIYALSSFFPVPVRVQCDSVSACCHLTSCSLSVMAGFQNT